MADPQDMPLASVAEIAQIYDAYAKLPKPDPADKNPTPIFPDPADTPAGALPASLEYDGLHGRIITTLDAVPSDSLLHHPAVEGQVQGDVQSIKFDEMPSGDWRLYLQGDDIHSGVHFALPKAEAEAMFARDGIVLYGRPSDEDLAAVRSAKAASDAENNANTPPF